MTEQLDNATINNVFLTLAKLHREDHCGEYSFQEIGYRLLPEHSDYVEGNHNFNLIHIPSNLNNQIAWEITKKLVKKNKDSDSINKLLEFIAEKGFTQVKPKVFQD